MSAVQWLQGPATFDLRRRTFPLPTRPPASIIGATNTAQKHAVSTPNILYLHSHDTGRYVSPYGHALPTPHIQRFAEQGVVFRRAFSAAPTCSPSTAMLVYTVIYVAATVVAAALTLERRDL